MSFRELLDTWEKSARVTHTESTYAVHLPLDTAARIEALVEMFPGRSREEIITDLISESLDALAAAMPYVPGNTVIREDDHGDPVYEDRGHMPLYMDLTRKHRKALDGGKGGRPALTSKPKSDNVSRKSRSDRSE